MKRGILLLIVVFSLSSEAWFAMQVHPPLSPNVLVSHETFSLQEQYDLKVHINENVVNPAFYFVKQLLVVSAERGPDDYVLSIFDTSFDVDAPLRPNLRLKFSIFASQLNLNTDAVRLYLFLVNGTNLIVLSYAVGFKEQDRVPDPDADRYSYVSYQVGNNNGTWFKGERDVWSDLIGKNLSVGSSPWTIHKMILGVVSYQKEKGIANYKMEGFFNVSETLLYYEDLTFARVTSQHTQFSWLAISGLVIDILLFFVCSVLLIKTKAHSSKKLRSFCLEECEEGK